MLALVGPSGGGKSTIANLLTRFWDVDSGSINIRGTNIKNVKLADLMNHISMVFQRVYLFQDTIYNNISIGRLEATEKEVIEAAKKLGVMILSWHCQMVFKQLLGKVVQAFPVVKNNEFQLLDVF